MTFGPSGVFGNNPIYDMKKSQQKMSSEKCTPIVFKAHDEDKKQDLFCVDFGEDDIRCVDYHKSNPKKVFEDIKEFLEEENQCINPSVQIGNDGAIDYIEKGWKGNF